MNLWHVGFESPITVEGPIEVDEVFVKAPFNRQQLDPIIWQEPKASTIKACVKEQHDELETLLVFFDAIRDGTPVSEEMLSAFGATLTSYRKAHQRLLHETQGHCSGYSIAVKPRMDVVTS